MPARSGAAGAPPAAPPVPPRRGPARDVDGLIRDLQRINLSQCMDQLTADIQQLSSMERQLSSAWQGLYVRCPGPEPDDLTAEPADKKSSSGYSTESGSPPGSRNTSGDTIDAHAVDGYRTEGPMMDRHGTDRLAASGYRTEGNLLNGHRSSGHAINGSAANTHVVNGNAVNRHVVTGSAVHSQALNSHALNSHAVNTHAVNSHTMNSQTVNGHAVNTHAVNGNAVNGHPDCSDGDGVYGRGRTTVDSFKLRAGSPGWGGRRAEGGYGLTASALVRETERATGAGQRSVAVNGAQRSASTVVNGFGHRNGPGNGLNSGHGNGLGNGFSNGLSGGFGNRVANGLGGVADVSTTSDGFSLGSAAGAELGHGSQGGLRSGERVGSEQPWRPLAGLESPVVARRCGGGLLQSSVAHSSQPRPVTPLVSRAPFCPPAASTPTLSPKLPRSPKTLRFAASHELIPPESPRGRRRVAPGAPPRPGILRSRASSVERPSPALSRPAAPGWRAADSSGSSPSPGREAADSAERFSRVVSALTKLEAELSASGAGRGGSVRLPSARAVACGTAQFVRQPPRRHLSFTALPPPPRHPPLLTGSATDSDDSDSDCGSDSRWLVDASAAARRQSEMPSEGDFVLSRGARLPPPYAGPPPRRRRPQLSWLLSCGSKRRPPSPPSAYLPPPPSEPSASPAAGAAYGCNLCKARFSEHTQLVSHVHERHVRVQMRPKYSCGLCPARFYASKFLARHCAYHHNSMGDARTPQCLKAEGRA